MSDCNEYDDSTTVMFYTKMTRPDGTWSICMLPSNDEGNQLQLTNSREAAQRNADELARLHYSVKYEVAAVAL